MKDTPRRKSAKPQEWPRKVTVGRVSIPIYRRTAPSGHTCFMVVDSLPDGNGRLKRKFHSFSSESDAMEKASRLANQLSERDTVGASITKEQAIEFASAKQTLDPLGLSFSAVVATITEAVKIVGDLPGVVAAARFYAARHKRTTAKRVSDVVAELLTVKEARGASPRYLQDLRTRLEKFAGDNDRDACNITTPDVQGWLDGLKLGSQSYANYRRVVHLFFEFAVARGYAGDNPVAGVEKVKVRNGEIEILSSGEIARLLAAAAPGFLPCIALGAFAGLRSAEIERLEWSDIHLAEKFIVIGASKAKTAGRRIVPLADNLASWLQPYAGQGGKIWGGLHDAFYEEQQATAKAAGLKWKSNALRHSYASYRFALTNDAGRVAGECGNSAAVIHKHYRELVQLGDAEKWFGIRPGRAANVLPLTVAASK